MVSLRHCAIREDLNPYISVFLRHNQLTHTHIQIHIRTHATISFSVPKGQKYIIQGCQTHLINCSRVRLFLRAKLVFFANYWFKKHNINKFIYKLKCKSITNNYTNLQLLLQIEPVQSSLIIFLKSER